MKPRHRPEPQGGPNDGTFPLARGDGQYLSRDFWGVFPVTSTTYCAVLGDVTGSGPHAAAIAALARHRIRAAARVLG